MRKKGSDLLQCRNIEENLARLAFIVESSEDAIIGKTLDGIITSWNRGAEKMYGYTADEAIGKPITMLAPPDRLDEVLSILEKVRCGERVEHLETVRLSKGGGSVHISLRISPIVDGSGKMIGTSAIARDITERKLAEAELERKNADLEAANRELEAFNYTVSHDLHRPLTVINGYVQIMQQSCGNHLSGECRKYLQEIYGGTLQMTQLIATLLDFSRLIRAEVHRETVDLSGIAKAIALQLKAGAPERNVTFTIAEAMTGTGDAALLRVVMENLLSNAWKYTSERSEATIEVGSFTAANGSPVFFVRDNGIGFATTNIDELFAPFTRLPEVKDLPGQGIGLATVDRIIRRHGGKVCAMGKPGEGATFYFTLDEH